MNAIERALSTWWLNRKASLDVLLDRKASAIDDLRRIVALNGRDEVARAALGNLLAETGDSPGAMEEFEAIVALNPANAEAWFNLGYLHDQRDELQDAERAFRRSLELKPSIDRAWYGLGLVLIRQGRLTEAVEALRRNIKLQPFSPYGYYQLAMTYHHLGQAAEAGKVHDELQKFEPKYAATLKRDIARTPPRASQRSAEVTSSKEGNAAHGT
ncbi:MAG TPA: tetratricopeptide repeat protein [Burkholderiaceae bacterium]|nr:tetratricopeptide repeat protein [Burkholderiaceae bacterium]